MDSIKTWLTTHFAFNRPEPQWFKAETAAVAFMAIQVFNGTLGWVTLAEALIIYGLTFITVKS